MASMHPFGPIYRTFEIYFFILSLKALPSGPGFFNQMPIYEYEAESPDSACQKCRPGFEVFQQINDKPLAACPRCGRKVKKIISWCRSAVLETSEEHMKVEKKIKQYEESGMWSHAAELADKHSEKTKDKGLKMRALDDYKKAGYDSDSLAKHAKLDDD